MNQFAWRAWCDKRNVYLQSAWCGFVVFLKLICDISLYYFGGKVTSHSLFMNINFWAHLSPELDDFRLYFLPSNSFTS